MLNSEIEIYKKALDEIACILTTDEKAIITYVNNKYCQLTQQNREDVIGHDIRIIRSGYYAPDFFDKMNRELSKGNVYKTKFRNITGNKTEYWLDATVYPVFNEKNEPYQVLAIMFDVTDKINEISRKEEMLADISHEIRTPLHGILSFVDLLGDTPMNSKQKDYIAYIHDSALQLEYLVNDLLDIFKTDAGKLKFTTTPFNVKNIVSALTEVLSIRGTNKKIEFDYRIDENISDLLLGDPYRLKQILCNQLNNCINFTDEGRILLQVKLVEEVGDVQTIGFVIEDDAASLSAEKQDELLSKFMQSNVKDPRMYCRTGLGMSVIKKLIELQDGAMEIISSENDGTSFTFRIPYKKSPTNTDKESPKTLFNRKKDERYNILIADDDKINQLIFSKQMEMMNYDFKIVDDGLKAIQQLQQESFDMVLLDMQMPGMNGDEVLLKIRNEFPEPVKNIPIICITATIHPETIRNLIESGANGYLSKPYKSAELKAQIEKTFQDSTRYAAPVADVPIQENNSLFNLELLYQFADGNTDFIVELLEYMKTAIPNELENMDKSFRMGSKQLARQLHKYRSQVSLLGMAQLIEMTMIMENNVLNSNDFSAFTDDFKRLTQLSVDALTEMDVLIQEMKSEK